MKSKRLESANNSRILQDSAKNILGLYAQDSGSPSTKPTTPNHYRNGCICYKQSRTEVPIYYLLVDPIQPCTAPQSCTTKVGGKHQCSNRNACISLASSIRNIAYSGPANYKSHKCVATKRYGRRESMMRKWERTLSYRSVARSVVRSVVKVCPW